LIRERLAQLLDDPSAGRRRVTLMCRIHRRS
jgi:hypothetical protein